MTARKNNKESIKAYKIKLLEKGKNKKAQRASLPVISNITAKDNIHVFINSMTYDDLLEASKLSMQYIHGEKAEEVQSPKAKEYYRIMLNSPNNRYTDLLRNKINSRLLYMNKKRHPVTKESINLYKKLMGE